MLDVNVPISRYTLMTSVFSHMDWSHILFNGFTFLFMAKPVLEILGSRRFILLYLGGRFTFSIIYVWIDRLMAAMSWLVGGLISSISSLTYAKVVGKNDYNSHGASGKPSLFHQAWILAALMSYSSRCYIHHCHSFGMCCSQTDLPTVWNYTCSSVACSHWILHIWYV